MKYRQLLADQLLQAGPEAPTLCGDYDARHLAAHLCVRENQPLAAAGLVVTPLKGWCEKATAIAAARDFESLIDEFRTGPRRTLMAVPLVNKLANVFEFYIHHEDVRRPNFPESANPLEGHDEQQLYKAVRVMSSFLVGQSSAPVVIAAEGYRRILAHDTRGVALQGNDVVTIFGPIGEIVLYLYNRPADGVTVTGDPERLKLRTI